MIERYESKAISELWTDQHKFKKFLEVEIALVEALEGKKIPEGVSEVIKENAEINPKRIKEIEQYTKHDVIAFCSSITEHLPADTSKYFHFGCTSSDIIDTATNLIIKESCELIANQINKLLENLLNKANETKHIICMGRSHGMNAEPMSFGQKFLSSYAEISRHFKDFKDFYNNSLTGQLSGAVGNYTILTPEIEEEALKTLGLKAEPISTQVIPRDYISKLVQINALIGSALERLAVEIRHLHHSDINEVYEGFSKGQKGSSIMPHKKNPVSAENITGLARILRSHVSIALENITLWHERDISHSSAERIMLPDNLGILFYALKRMSSTVENLVINKDAIQEKVLKSYTYLSSYTLHKILLENTVTREDAYEVIQKASFDSNSVLEFIEAIEKSGIAENSDLNSLKIIDETNMRKVFLSNVEKVFERVTNSYPL